MGSEHSGNAPVLITGGAGYIGAHLTHLLLEAGYRVRVFDNFCYGFNGLNGTRNNDNLETVRGDIFNHDQVQAAVAGTRAVIALAAIVGDAACELNPQRTIDLNYEATKILIDACITNGVRRLVFASSCSVYGASDQMLDETSPLNPISLYAKTRVQSEEVLLGCNGQLEPVILRLATAFGVSPRMRFDLVINTFAVRAATNQAITVYGGDQWRPAIHCRDAARAFQLAAEAPAADVSRGIFNVGGSAQNFTIRDLAALVARVVPGADINVVEDVTDPRSYRVSFDRIRQVLGFQPGWSVEQGIREITAAVEREPALRDFEHPRFHNARALQGDHSDLEASR